MKHRSRRLLSDPSCSAPANNSVVPFVPEFYALIRFGDNDNDPSGATEFKVGTNNTGQMSWGTVPYDGQDPSPDPDAYSIETGLVPIQFTMGAGGGTGAVVLTVDGTSITYDDAAYGEIFQLDVQAMAASDKDCTITLQDIRVNGVDLPDTCKVMAAGGRLVETDAKDGNRSTYNYNYGARLILLPSGTTVVMLSCNLNIHIDVPHPSTDPPPFNIVRAYIWVNAED